MTDGETYILNKLYDVGPITRKELAEWVEVDDILGVDYVLDCLDFCFEDGVVREEDGKLIRTDGWYAKDVPEPTAEQHKAACYLRACKRMHAAWLKEREHRCYEQERGYRMRREARLKQAAMAKAIISLLTALEVGPPSVEAAREMAAEARKTLGPLIAPYVQKQIERRLKDG